MGRVDTRVVACTVVLGFLFACSGLKEATQSSACCSVDDVIEMTASGVEPQVINDAIRTSGTDLDLSAEDITRMAASDVDATVIDTLNGGPCECVGDAVPAVADPQPTLSPATATPDAVPKGLNVAVKYSGGKSFELVNLSNTTYTGLSLVVNNEFQYGLKKLPKKSADNIRMSTFVSRKTGASAKKVKIKTIYVSADQGTYSRSF